MICCIYWHKFTLSWSWPCFLRSFSTFFLFLCGFFYFITFVRIGIFFVSFFFCLCVLWAFNRNLVKLDAGKMWIFFDTFDDVIEKRHKQRRKKALELYDIRNCYIFYLTVCLWRREIGQVVDTNVWIRRLQWTQIWHWVGIYLNWNLMPFDFFVVLYFSHLCISVGHLTDAVLLVMHSWVKFKAFF